MRKLYLILFLLSVFSCVEKELVTPFTKVEINNIYEDSINIRAIDIEDNTLRFAANKGRFGAIDLRTGKITEAIEKYHTVIPEFRAIAHNSTDFFMISINSPALLYKTGKNRSMELVYKEEGNGVFYDAMNFWNDKEGIAMGDSVNGCISIIITRDGGQNWSKLGCEQLPGGIKDEGAFAASNTNIEIVGDKVWIATTKRILFSNDKGLTWQVQQTPLLTKLASQGIYSVDFYDENLGVVIGGDYMKPDANKANAAITKNGGKTWKLVADGKNPSYKSCVKFVPESNGKELVAIGLTGISYSSDTGETWTNLSNESFYSIRFLNDSIAYASGKNRISKLSFK